MTTHQTAVYTLLHDLHARGITLWLEGEHVRCRAPKGSLTTADQGLLTAHRAALVTWLRQQAALEAPGASRLVPPGLVCPPHVPYDPIPSQGPLRQCQMCPHVWSVACACGSTQWRLQTATETWCCRSCGTGYAAWRLRAWRDGPGGSAGAQPVCRPRQGDTWSP